MNETTEQIHARWEREAQTRKELDAWSDQFFVKIAFYIVGIVAILLGAGAMFVVIGAFALLAKEYGLLGIVIGLCAIWLLVGAKSVGRGILTGVWRMGRDRC
jgi:hypothetical protein